MGRSLFYGSARRGRGRYRYDGITEAPPADVALLDYTEPTASSTWTSTDWIQTRYDDATGTYNPVPMVPAPGQEVMLTTPMLACPWGYSGTTGDGVSMNFQYRVKAGPGATTTVQPSVAGRNYVILQTELVRGTEYEWRAEHPTSGYSDWRPFTVSTDAVSAVVPTGQALYNIAAAKAHPRTLPSDYAARLVLFQTGGGLRSYTTEAITDFNAYEGDALPWEGTTTSPYGTIRTEYFRIMECWWLWKIENDTQYRDEGLRRVRGLITPSNGVNSGWLVEGGQSSYSSPGDDQAARAMIYACTTGFDLFYDELTTTDRTQAATMVAPRIKSYIDDTAQIGKWPLRSNWELSHPLNHLAVGGLAGLVFAGHESLVGGTYSFSTNIPIWGRNADFALQDFNGYVDEVGCHRQVNSYSRFQWEYATLVEHLGNIASLDLWSIARNGLQADTMYSLFPAMDGSDWRTPFGDSGLAGFPDHMALTYWLPRADGRWSRYMTAAGLNANSVVSTGRQWHLLRSVPAAAGTEEQRDNVLYADAGVLALHSDERDTARLSLWMRASPGGSYGHNHMDHGSIVIAKAGVPLLIHSGSYGENSGQDDFNGANGYWDNYKRTWFKNCITMDGRAGQQRWNSSSDVRNFRTRGKFIRALAYEDYSYAVADLEGAYQQASYVNSKAIRAVVYLRPNVFLVFDAHDLSSGSYTWEWLFHTAAQPVNNSGTVTVTSGAQSLTIQNLYANRAQSSITVNDSAWPGGVDPGATDEWHNSFNYASGSTLRACHMIVVNNVTGGATPSAASCTTDANGMVASVTLNGVSWTVNYNQTTDAITVA
jgi:hypothetical protein